MNDYQIALKLQEEEEEKINIQKVNFSDPFLGMD